MRSWVPLRSTVGLGGMIRGWKREVAMDLREVRKNYSKRW